MAAISQTTYSNAFFMNEKCSISIQISDADPVHRRIYAPLGKDELTTVMIYKVLRD